MPQLRTEQNKAGMFDGPQIRKLIKDLLSCLRVVDLLSCLTVCLNLINEAERKAFFADV